MRDFILTFPTEQDAITALPEFRIELEAGEQWIGPIIPSATRWITRPQYDEDGEIITPPETVPGWHCIVRAESLPEAAQPFIVTDPGDIEPVPAGGLMKPVVPQVVSRFQARAALEQHGVLDDVESLIATPEIPRLLKLAWEDAQSFERQSPSILLIAGLLAWTDEFVDQLFITAGGITA